MTAYTETEGIPLDLLAPPRVNVDPPLDTKVQLAPLGELPWNVFEQLCVALIREEAEAERVRRYGTRGQSQEGIDLYARKGDGRYAVYQCKQTQDLSPAAIEKAVANFRGGDWFDRSDDFVICATASGLRTERAEAIEAEATRLADDEVRFEVWDAEEISRKLKVLPIVVFDFFGAEWVDRFCSLPLPETAAGRLEGPAIQELRARLGRFYQELFERHEPSLSIKDAVGLSVLRQRRLPTAARSHRENPIGEQDIGNDAEAGREDTLLAERLTLSSWLARGRRSLLLGSAGSGKSTALRQICLDLLSEEPLLGDLGQWADFIPIWLPFATWAGRAGTEPSVEAAVSSFFESYDEKDLGALARRALADERLVLLVDGIDEWTDPSAAGLAWDRLEQVAAMREVSVLAAGRREALGVLGVLGSAWEQAELAALSEEEAVELLIAHGADSKEAAAHIAELTRSSSVAPLARIPLLLAMTWQVRSTGPLPASRVEAVDRILDRLMDDYPKRRERAGGFAAEPLALDKEDEKIAIEELALVVQEHGPVPLPQARARETLKGTLEARGFTTDESTREGRSLLANAAGAMGLLLAEHPGVSFTHRALQEQLTARAIKRRRPEEQVRIVEAKASAITWRGVLIALITMTEDPRQAEALVESIELAEGLRDRWARAGMLAQIAIEATYLEPSGRRRLVAAARDEIEQGLNPVVRSEVVDALSEGIGLPQTASIAGRARHWLPRRFDWGAWGALAEWSPEDEKIRSRVTETFFRGLGSEDQRAARAAGGALLSLRPADLADRLIERLGLPIAPGERAASLDTLARAWPEDERVARWMSRARESEENLLRLVALGWRVHRGLHDDQDKKALYGLLDGWTHVDLAWSGAAAEILQAGWPDDVETRDRALETVGLGRRRPIEITSASWLLLGGYHRDSRVEGWILTELASEHPFVVVDDVDAYRLLGQRVAHEPAVREAIDRRLPKLGRSFMPALYSASLATRSQEARHILLETLESEDSGALGWVVRGLKEGWAGDQEVTRALEALAGRTAAGWVTDQLVDFVAPGRLDGWLLERLSDPGNRRPSRALLALADRGEEVRAEAFAVGSSLLGELKGRADDQVLEVLISHYADLEGGEKLAFRYLDDGRVPFSTFVRGAQIQPALSGPVLDRFLPLPQALRRRVAERLGEGAGAPVGARAVVSDWRAELSPPAATDAAAADARRCPDDERDRLTETAIESLHTFTPPTREGYPGLAVLIELGQLDRFAKERARWGDEDPLTLDLNAHYEPDWALGALLASRWAEMEQAVGEPADRLGRADRHGVWELIAPFAAAQPEARRACLRFIREHGVGARPGLLGFLADARPRSQELLAALVEAVDGGINDRSPMRDTLLLGSELMAEHFGRGGEPPAALTERIDRAASAGVILCLAIGWPESRVTADVIDDLNSTRRRLPIDVEWRVVLALSGAREAQQAIDGYLDYSAGQGRFVPPPPQVLERRVAKDKELVEQLSATLVGGNPRPSQLASYAKLLSSASRLEDPARKLVEDRCRVALEGEDVDIVAFDLLASENRPLGLSLSEALRGAS